MVYVDVSPDVLQWAADRSDPERIRERYPNLDKWRSMEKKPTLKQLEDYSRSTHTPIGYFFLKKPPVIEVPIPDLRTIASRTMKRPSPDMIDTIHLCQQRQEWYQGFARRNGLPDPDMVGCASIDDDVAKLAKVVRRRMGFAEGEFPEVSTWTEGLSLYIERVEALGILVMLSGVVGSNNRRKLDPEEFRGFALMDDHAPLIFINGSDTKAAQTFTLMHELAHILIGEGGVSDEIMGRDQEVHIEKWCNECAAEILVPEEMLNDIFDEKADLEEEANRMARKFKVSTLVILRRLLDIRKIDQERYRDQFNNSMEKFKDAASGQGGNFYHTTNTRIGKRFARALISSTLEGQTLFKDAFRMIGISKISTFEEIGRRLGV